MAHPEDFKKLLLEKFRAHHGNAVHVAHDVDVGISTLKRWVHWHDLRAEVALIRRKARHTTTQRVWESRARN